ncbi:hydrolase [Duganella rhizosphaerae]
MRCGAVSLDGLLALPDAPAAMVLFAHGSGSSRLSPRNTQLANALHADGFGTLLMDLLTPLEDLDPNTRFDIALLTRRLACGADWLGEEASTAALPLGVFGASTGAAAALRLAAMPDAAVAALALRGGRTDLAGAAELAKVHAPTLFIVGALDELVVAINRISYLALPAEKELAIIAGASHLFEEPGKLDEVALLAGRWFTRHLADAARRGA